MDIRKVYLLILLCTFCILSPVYTQQSLSDEFRKVAGDYAALYTSKVEVGYSPYLYINHPYWDTDEFKKGAVCYGGLVYTDLQLRYDTFKKQLIVITPEKRILLQVDMRKVAFGCVHVLSPSIFRYMEDERWTGKFSIIPFYVDICPKARIQGFPIDSENWFDVGKPETLAKAEAYYASL